ncbi:MAG: hypothetical protein A2W19_04760 [Spirochaetes bacterium RBG_16_49_21]|nr:MAG: hypothetical protein A2W19_04760 [Spirochaetes bacterium RBG_16_49_21]
MNVKYFWLILMLTGSLMAGNCDSSENDSKKNQSLLLLLAGGGGTGTNQVIIDGTLKTVYVDGGTPTIAASYDVDNNFTTVAMDFDSAGTERIDIIFPGHATGTFNANSTASHRLIIYTFGALFISDAAFGGSGTISITKYDIPNSLVEGTFNGIVFNMPGGSSHTLANGRFIAPLM